MKEKKKESKIKFEIFYQNGFGNVHSMRFDQSGDGMTSGAGVMT